jgi:hypothetical protein
MYDILSEVKELIINARKAYYENSKFQELATTERERNIARIKALTTALRARREVAEAYSSQFFEERKLLREMAEVGLNKAIEDGDALLAQMTIELIEFEYGKDLFGKLNKIL